MASKKDSVGVESSEMLAVLKAINHFAVKIYHQLATDGTNVFFSPLSLSCVLSMLNCGAKSETSEEMRHVLGYDAANVTDDNVKTSFKYLHTTLKKSHKSYTLTTANIFLTQRDFHVKEAFKTLLERYFRAMTFEVDFRKNPKDAIQRVNKWVKENTNGMIPKLLESLARDTVMVILNAVYFKGFWLHPFKKRDTCRQNFYNKGLENNVNQIDMMHLWETSFPFVHKESFKALQLPYKGKEISMMILLPNSNTGLSELESKITPDFMEDLKAEMFECEVDVTIPKFRIEYSKSLKENFQCLGMNRVFNSGADLENITDSQNLHLSEIIHKAVLVVNEEGSEAVAATAAIVENCCLSNNPEFIADHPFLFLIYNTKTNLFLFMGKVEEL